MFREFNVKFEDVEMLGGADNLLEGTEITKVIVRGDNNKMSSLDSMLKNCNELDTIDGELDLNGVSDIDNFLEGTELVKSINLKNINNENISANNSFPHVDQINIGGELYNKRAMQNVIASKEWAFDNINYQGAVSDNIVTKEVNIVDDNKVTIQDTLEQKAKGLEIIGQTYENLVVGSGEATLLDELTLESVDGSPNEFSPHLEQPVCVKVVEGNTVQDESNIYSLGELQEDGTYKIDILTESSILKGLTKTYKQNSATIITPKRFMIESKNGRWSEAGISASSTYKKLDTPYTLCMKVISKNLLDDNYSFATSWRGTSNVGFGYKPDLEVGVVYKKSVSPQSDVREGDTICIFQFNTNAVNGQHIELEIWLEEDIVKSEVQILLPQPLNKIGDIKDKFYWDDDKGHYCIEQKFSQEKANGLNWIIFNQNDNFIYFRGSQLLNTFKHSDKGLCNKLACYQQYSLSAMNKEGISLRGNTMDIVLPKARGILSIEQLKAFINDLFVIWELEIPQIIDLPHLNKKYFLDTYMPTTYLECTNSPIQPSRMLLESDTVRYKPSVLETDTDYTIQFECKEKSDKKVKLNLGGTEKEVDIEVGLNHVSITTPSEIDTSLYKDRLFLSGAGNKVADVIVAEGEMNQYPEYFDGVQSTGELQDDGTYKIGVSTENEFKNTNLWDGKKVSDYATDFIEIYDNTFSLNSYDAYITEYDADRQLVTREYITSTANKMLTAKNSNCKYITVRSNIFKETDPYYVKEGLLVLSNRMVSLKEKPTGFRNSLKVLISSNNPLAKGDKLYWNKSNKRYEIDRSGSVEVPTVEGDIIDLPRLYQGEDTHLTVESGNIKPSKIKIDYNDLD